MLGGGNAGSVGLAASGREIANNSKINAMALHVCCFALLADSQSYYIYNNGRNLKGYIYQQVAAG